MYILAYTWRLVSATTPDSSQHTHNRWSSNLEDTHKEKELVGANYIHHAPQISQQAYHAVCLRALPLASCPGLGSKRWMGWMHDTRTRT